MSPAMRQRMNRGMDMLRLKATGRALAVMAAGMVVTWLPGCATAPPQQYYTLDMRPSGKVSTPLTISVGMINIAEPLAQKNILIKKSPTEVEYYAVGQWVGSLDELLREKLEAELGQPVGAPRTLALTAELFAFEQVDVIDAAGAATAEANIKMEVQLRESGKSRYTPPLHQRIYNIQVPCPDTSVNGLVVALSRGVEQLAAEIVADAAKL